MPHLGNAEELLEKLAALVPIPRAHLIRYHGCLAPNSKLRPQVLPRVPHPEFKDSKEKRSRRRMRWAQLLKRVFKADLETCTRCGGRTKVLAAILDVSTIEKILGHLGLPTTPPRIHPPRAPPQEVFVC